MRLFVSDVLDAWAERSLVTWAPSSVCDQRSRVAGIKKNQGGTPVTGPPMSVADGKLEVISAGGQTVGTTVTARTSPNSRSSLRHVSA